MLLQLVIIPKLNSFLDPQTTFTGQAAVQPQVGVSCLRT